MAPQPKTLSLSDSLMRSAASATLALVVALLAALPYFVGGVSPNFIILDDNKYIYENPQVLQGLTPGTLTWAFTSTEDANWYPLRRLSHLVDVSLFGLDARRHHMVSIGWHAAAAILFFLALRALTGATWRVFVVAGLFAVHPIQVESVAWAAERSNVLAGFFLALTLLLWARYARRPSPGRYAPVLLCCAIGLMAKPVLVTLPFVLLLLDAWPLGRMSPPGAPPWRIAAPLIGRRLLEKIPLLLLSAGAGTMAIVAHRQVESLHGVTETLPPGVRLANAALSYWRYLGKLFCPSDLAVFYPHPGAAFPMSKAALAGILLAALTALVLSLARRRPWLAAGWLWYAGMMVPTIGIVPFGSHAMADRFAYLPSVGIFLALVWLAAEGLPTRLRRPALLGPVAGAVLAALAIAGAVQASYWKNSETLFMHSIAATRNNWMMHFMMGLVREGDGRLGEAATHYREALRIMPINDEAHNNLGIVYAREGQLGAAVAHYREALRLRPRNPQAHNNLANVYFRQGLFPEAIPLYREALRLDPSYADAHANLGMALAATGRNAEAVIHYREALRILPGDPELRLLLDALLAVLGRPGETAVDPTGSQ